MALKAVLSEDEFAELDENMAENYEWSQQDNTYVLSHEIVKNHPGWSKVKRTADQNKKTAEQTQRERDEMKRRLGPLAEAEDLDLENADEDTVNNALALLKGEGGDAGQPASGNSTGKPKGQDVDLDKVKQNARKPVERERDQVVEERDRLKTQLEQTLREQALSDAFSQVGIASPYVGPLKSYFGKQIKIGEDEDGNPKPLIETEYGEQAVPSYIKEWAASEEGKAFIAGNNGSGARGAGTSTTGKQPNPFRRETKDFDEQMRLAREQPEVAKRMAQEAGAKLPV